MISQPHKPSPNTQVRSTPNELSWCALVKSRMPTREKKRNPNSAKYPGDILPPIVPNIDDVIKIAHVDPAASAREAARFLFKDYVPTSDQPSTRSAEPYDFRAKPVNIMLDMAAENIKWATSRECAARIAISEGTPVAGETRYDFSAKANLPIGDSFILVRNESVRLPFGEPVAEEHARPLALKVDEYGIISCVSYPPTGCLASHQAISDNDAGKEAQTAGPYDFRAGPVPAPAAGTVTYDFSAKAIMLADDTSAPAKNEPVHSPLDEPVRKEHAHPLTLETDEYGIIDCEFRPSESQTGWSALNQAISNDGAGIFDFREPQVRCSQIAVDSSAELTPSRGSDDLSDCIACVRSTAQQNPDPHGEGWWRQPRALGGIERQGTQ